MNLQPPDNPEVTEEMYIEKLESQVTELTNKLEGLEAAARFWQDKAGEANEKLAAALNSMASNLRGETK